ncbi:hypothetical protein Y1Q_0020202 [Alligator mississippiensis]|uniref:Uncharacterized protein n=1 Tax=Alligator mississippiensis TaxID=8496 RepID=A0A151MZT6_ALLMI|nr:hypothetical protein Y1Q_0020202 [Alligator mississippiensis]
MIKTVGKYRLQQGVTSYHGGVAACVYLAPHLNLLRGADKATARNSSTARLAGASRASQENMITYACGCWEDLMSAFKTDGEYREPSCSSWKELRIPRPLSLDSWRSQRAERPGFMQQTRVMAGN